MHDYKENDVPYKQLLAAKSEPRVSYMCSHFFWEKYAQPQVKGFV